MPKKSGKMTPQEALFIGYLASTDDPTYAAKMARYSQAQAQGWQKSHNPAIIEATRKAQIKRLNSDLLPKSLDLLEKVLGDDKEATRNRLTAAQTVLKYSLGQSDSAESKEPHEMTPQELQDRIDSLRRAMADKAKPIIDSKASETSVFE